MVEDKLDPLEEEMDNPVALEQDLDNLEEETVPVVDNPVAEIGFDQPRTPMG
jgi:hypothetical protein